MSKKIKDEKVEETPKVPPEETAEYKLRKVLRKYVPPLTRAQVKEIVEEVVFKE